MQQVVRVYVFVEQTTILAHLRNIFQKEELNMIQKAPELRLRKGENPEDMHNFVLIKSLTRL
jgi:hypothetical protein